MCMKSWENNTKIKEKKKKKNIFAKKSFCKVSVDKLIGK